MDLKIFYVKTDNFTLDEILDFCEEIIDDNPKMYNDWKLFHKDNFRNFYPHSNILIFDEYCRLLAVDDQDLRTKSGHIIWSTISLDELDIDNLEYYDFSEYNAYVDKGYSIVEAGKDSENKWIFLKAENNYTHYRSFLLNWQTFISLPIYIRKRKIKKILE